MVNDFAGKTALITGAGRGIGRALALGLADTGAELILVARSVGQLAQTQAILLGRGASGGQIRVVPAELGDEQQRGHVIAAALATGRVDILVNNAATVEPLGPTAVIPVAELRRAFELNVIAPAALTAAVLPDMLETGWGRIVNVSSAIVARPDFMVRFNAHAATKAALEAHTVNLADRRRPHRPHLRVAAGQHNGPSLSPGQTGRSCRRMRGTIMSRCRRDLQIMRPRSATTRA